MITNMEEYMNLSRSERRKHLDLSMGCIERGGTSTQHKAILAVYLDTIIPSGNVLCCHACNNGRCSNPEHLYWGTYQDNRLDGKECGAQKSPWEYMVEKYGEEQAREINKKNGFNNKTAKESGSKNKGVPKSFEHRNKISETLKGKVRGKYKTRQVME